MTKSDIFNHLESLGDSIDCLAFNCDKCPFNYEKFCMWTKIYRAYQDLLKDKNDNEELITPLNM